MKDPDELLKRASAKKKAGDISGAITTLRQAYKAIAGSGMSYPVDTFLRLPMYLQQADRNDEAWHEFNILLAEGIPNEVRGPGLRAMDHQLIFDKMRLFSQREGKKSVAVRFGIFSYLSGAKGLHEQKRKKELEFASSRASTDRIIAELTKKAKKEHVKDEIVSIVERELKSLPSIDLPTLGNKIDQVLSR